MAVHPGMMIKPELDERGISQKEFAKMLGTQSSHLSEVLNGKRALTFSDLWNISPNALRAAYNRGMEQKKTIKFLDEISPLLNGSTSTRT